jgi:hypothetical protein
MYSPPVPPPNPKRHVVYARKANIAYQAAHDVFVQIFHRQACQRASYRLAQSGAYQVTASIAKSAWQNEARHAGLRSLDVHNNGV